MNKVKKLRRAIKAMALWAAFWGGVIGLFFLVMHILGVFYLV